MCTMRGSYGHSCSKRLIHAGTGAKKGSRRIRVLESSGYKSRLKELGLFSPALQRLREGYDRSL